MWTKIVFSTAAVLHKRLSLLTGILFIGMFASATTAMAAAPSVYSNWEKITDTQPACLQRAETTLRNSGFTGGGGGEKGTGTTYYGYSGDYTGMVRCAADVGIVYFIVAGPSSDMTSSYINTLRNGY